MSSNRRGTGTGSIIDRFWLAAVAASLVLLIDAAMEDGVEEGPLIMKASRRTVECPGHAEPDVALGYAYPYHGRTPRVARVKWWRIPPSVEAVP